MRLYHGTDLFSATRFLAGEVLDAARAAALKTDGPPGFFLATDIADAEFFALRQMRGNAVVLAVDFSDAAAGALVAAGALCRPIPRGPQSPWFVGEEWVIPPALFELYNQLLQKNEIHLSPT